MVILLKGYWCLSMNPGEDCESDVIAIFNSQKDLDKHISSNGIILGKVTQSYEEEPSITADKEWYFTQKLDENSH